MIHSAKEMVPDYEELAMTRDWGKILDEFDDDWRKELEAGNLDPEKLRSELMQHLISPEGFHFDEKRCNQGWARYCPNDRELKDFVREVAQCKAWLRLRGNFEPRDKTDGILKWGSSWASYWRCQIDSHVHDSISVGAVIAAAISLGLVVERDGWGCFLDNGYFDANIYAPR